MRSLLMIAILTLITSCASNEGRPLCQENTLSLTPCDRPYNPAFDPSTRHNRFDR